MNNAQKLKELEQKLAFAEERYKLKLSRFRGVPHESAAGELAYSDLKVLEDHVATIKAELAILKSKAIGS
jgi:hypothetical protein